MKIAKKFGVVIVSLVLSSCSTSNPNWDLQLPSYMIPLKLGTSLTLEQEVLFESGAVKFCANFHNNSNKVLEINRLGEGKNARNDLILAVMDKHGRSLSGSINEFDSVNSIAEDNYIEFQRIKIDPNSIVTSCRKVVFDKGLKEAYSILRYHPPFVPGSVTTSNADHYILDSNYDYVSSEVCRFDQSRETFSCKRM
jgi:hypothetical protein